MEDLRIEGCKFTPDIIADGTHFTLTIRGKSYPENTFEFYGPVFDWLRRAVQLCQNQPEPARKLTVHFAPVYYNSSTSKVFYDIFDILQNAHDHGLALLVQWAFDPENETIQEAGEDFCEDFPDLHIQLTPLAPSAA